MVFPAVDKEPVMSEPKSLSFHVPAPAVRPGGTPDFSDVKISRAGEAPCAHVIELAERNLAAAEDRIRRLQAFRDRLSAQIAKWKGKTTCTAGGLCEIINSADLPSD